MTEEVEIDPEAEFIMRSSFTKQDFKLGFIAACVALNLDPSEDVFDEMARLAESPKDVTDAVERMRDAAKFDRVASALTLLRDRSRDRGRARLELVR